MEKIHFSDFPNFTPNLTPSEIFKFGSFGGTYWRPIHSSITGKNYQNIHTNYPKEWWYDIPENYLTNSWEDYDKYINLFIHLNIFLQKQKMDYKISSIWLGALVL